MRIAICEDEEVVAQQIWGYLFDKEEIEAQYFLGPEKLLAEYENGKRFDVLFCDACMEGMDGIELCRKLRKYDSDLYIVFITNYVEYAPAGYEIGLFRYLLKPVTKEMVEKVLAEIRQDADKGGKLVLKTSFGNMIVSAKDILYMEIQDKETEIHCEDSVFRVSKSLGELEEMVADMPFFRIHRKYLVNLERVREFDQFQLTLDDGNFLPISYRKNHEFKVALYQFLQQRK